ncbi:MAG: hypothetical protein JOZ54_04985 [Acidobacteria bacterium]|nr:hypothetical protein [Acidobacteriota bacterium]
MRIASFLLLALLAFPSLAADDAPMKKVAWLAGTWQGDGWIIGRGDEKSTFHQTEVVKLEAGDLVLVIDGTGKDDKGKVVHDAFAVVDYDSAAKQYRWHSWRAGGGDHQTAPEVSDGRFVWGMDVQGGKMRYTITKTAEGKWFEVGEFTRDGAQWSKFFEMTLTRK